MRRVKRWRYYCDHCGKGSGSGHHMQKHERGCTLNPNRICGFCSAAKLNPADLAQLVEIVVDGILEAVGRDNDANQYWDPVIEHLEDQADACPACMLAAIRQARNHPKIADVIDSKDQGVYWAYSNLGGQFSFSKRAQEFWEKVNDPYCY